LLLLLFGGGCFVLETESQCIDQAGLKLMILLPQPPKCLDYKQVVVTAKNSF
jgi:hypothetical protein